ncbi:hypothetical protein Hamer_G014019 [Homarus americanus]|uniref:Uncharacterized protein n=1 Tax=Homarus americanus TaxID=6706 RepID=A0A8J5JN76_HOMAM|nr:hypothetical protein Hamer_G014019 [Homarus americanus]
MEIHTLGHQECEKLRTKRLLERQLKAMLPITSRRSTEWREPPLRFICQGYNTRFNHLVVEVITFSCPLTNTSKHGVATVSLGHIVDKFHYKHSLAHTSTTKQT